jgi:hypothetical protein
MTAFQEHAKTGPVCRTARTRFGTSSTSAALADPYSRQRIQDPALLAKYKARLKEQATSS